MAPEVPIAGLRRAMSLVGRLSRSLDVILGSRLLFGPGSTRCDRFGVLDALPEPVLEPLADPPDPAPEPVVVLEALPPVEAAPDDGAVDALAALDVIEAGWLAVVAPPAAAAVVVVVPPDSPHPASPATPISRANSTAPIRQAPAALRS